MTDQEIKDLAAKQLEWAVALRRRLHRVPEPGNQEFETQKIITEALDELGIEYTTENTWTVGLIRGAYPGETVAYRADIDALPVEEPEG